MRLLRIFFKMLRVRVTLTLLVFYLMSLAWYGSIIHPNINMIWGALAIICAYGSATCFNDLADVKADKINLKGAGDRLLANERATSHEIMIVAIVAALLSFCFGYLAAPWGFIVVLTAFIINVTYSLPPLKISYRPLLVPFYLSLAYVAIPWSLGIFVSGQTFKAQPITPIIAFMLLFMARISLKDFRDRVGDKAAGKPTAVLRYGKYPVVIFAATSLLLGLLLILYLLPGQNWLKFFVVYQAILAASMLVELAIKKKPDEELLAIGLGARFGNGVLFSILGILILSTTQASAQEQLLLLGSISVLFSWFWIDIHIRPDQYLYGGGGFRLAGKGSKQ